MRIPTTAALFAWECLDDTPELRTLRELIESLPDEKLLSALRLRRYKGRNDYPVATLWRVFLLRYLLRHPSMESALAEFRRNPALRELALINDVTQVPKAGIVGKAIGRIVMPPTLAGLVLRKILVYTASFGSDPSTFALQVVRHAHDELCGARKSPFRGKGASPWQGH